MDLEELVKLRDEVMGEASKFRKAHLEKQKKLDAENEAVRKSKVTRGLERYGSDDYWKQLYSATEPNETFKTHQGGYFATPVARPPPQPQAVLPYEQANQDVSDLY